jgi:hypothetical protein
LTLNINQNPLLVERRNRNKNVVYKKQKNLSQLLHEVLKEKIPSIIFYLLNLKIFDQLF